MTLSGLVSKVLPVDQVVDEAVKLGEKIGEMSQIAVAMAKEAVNASQELSLSEGCRLEKRLFHSSFATVEKSNQLQCWYE